MAGPSGAVEYPTYISDAHQTVLGTGALTDDMFDIVENVHQNLTNPFTGQSAYDVSADLTAAKNDIDTYQTSVAAINETTLWATWSDAALTNLDEVLSPNLSLDEEVIAFEAGMKITLATAYNRLNSAMRAANAVVSTAYPNGLAGLEAANLIEVAKYRAQRAANMNKERATVFITNMQSIAQIFQAGLNGESTVAQLRDQYAKMAIAAEQNEINIEMDTRDRELKWGLDILGEGASMIGATSGIPGMEVGMNKWQMALANTGAAAGIAISGVAAIMSAFGGMIGGAIPFLAF